MTTAREAEVLLRLTRLKGEVDLRTLGGTARLTGTGRGSEDAFAANKVLLEQGTLLVPAPAGFSMSRGDMSSW